MTCLARPAALPRRHANHNIEFKDILAEPASSALGTPPGVRAHKPADVAERSGQKLVFVEAQVVRLP